MVRAGESHGADALGIERLAAQAAVADRLNGGRGSVRANQLEPACGIP